MTDVPRRAFLAREDVIIPLAAAGGVLTYIGAVAGAFGVVASGGALAMAMAAAGVGGAAAGGLGMLIARSLGQKHAREVEEQLATGGLVLWIRVRSPDREEKAQQILKAHGAAAVRVHEIEIDKRFEDIPLSSLVLDPWLGSEPLGKPASADMRYPAGYGAAAPWRGDNGKDNRGRNKPLLPGTSMPAHEPLPLVFIYQPAPGPTQDGRARSKEWILEFAPSYPTEIDPLTGWTGSRDPFAHIRLRFPDQNSAIAFAERQGWPYEVRDPPVRRFQPKSYADRFRYDLANAIARAQLAWDGEVSIADLGLVAR